jgi:outer membrane lipoprotein-sorting protein
VRYSDWEPHTGDQEHTSAAASGITLFPRVIQIDRPHDDYRLDFEVTKLTLNEDIPADRFKLEQPAGSELVRVGEGAPEKKP